MTKQTNKVNRSIMSSDGKAMRHGLPVQYRIRFGVHATLLAASMLLAGCAVGPNYIKPTVETPTAFKENQGWKVAQPQDAAVRGNWWEVFNDAQLNALEEQVNISNQTLAQAEARFRQASALVRSARAAYFPTLSTSASSSRSSARSTTQTTSTGAVITSGGASNTSNTLALDANWEVDVWGRVQRNVEANAANAEASAADVAATRLSTQAQLAQDYFLLRTLDAQADILARTLTDYERLVQLNQNQYQAGVAARGNVILAQSQYKSTQAQLIDVGVQRAQVEHAIALLVGKPASVFSIAAAPLPTALPPTPIGVPSALLERRPDIAAAERRAAAANAQIGVAEAAYFPALTLSASGGFAASSFADLLSLPNRFWSIGPSLALALFDGGARAAQTDQARAAYDLNVAAYRQTVLTGFQEVEDNLSTLRILEQEAAVQEEAVQLSRQSVALTMNQYKAGIISYLNVITVQATALANERAAADIMNRRLAASVLLVKALGGGWDGAMGTVAAK
jgi:NodT family efflux transporter outer membrane factor (OMF) lipoprotein